MIAGDRFAWQDRAACRGHMELFFEPDFERTPERLRREKAAITLCAVCPVRAECKAYAETLEPKFGIWAGRVAR